MSTASKAPVPYPVRPRHLRVAEPAPEASRSALALAVLVAMLALTVVAGWEEFRIDQRDDRISTLEGRVVDGNRTIGELQDRLARSTASTSRLREQIASLQGQLDNALATIGTVTARRDLLAAHLADVRATRAVVRSRLVETRDDLESARQEADAAASALVRLAGPPLEDGRYLGVVNFASTVGAQVSRPWTIGFVGIGERALVNGQGVMRVLPVARDTTVLFRSAIPNPPATYGFVDFEDLFYSTASDYAAVHSWNTGYVITVEDGRVVAIKATR